MRRKQRYVFDVAAMPHHNGLSYEGPPWGAEFEDAKYNCGQRTPECTANLCSCAIAVTRNWISVAAARLEGAQGALALTIYDTRKTVELSALTRHGIQNLRRSFARRINRAEIRDLRMIGFIDFEFKGRRRIKCCPHLHALAWAGPKSAALSSTLSTQFRWGNKARIPALLTATYDIDGWVDYLVKPIGELKYVRKIKQVRRKSELPASLRTEVLSAIRRISISDRFLFIGFKRSGLALKRWYRGISN